MIVLEATCFFAWIIIGAVKKVNFFYSPAKIADGKPRFLRELCVFCCKNSIKRKINGQKRRGPAPSKRSTAMEKLVKRVFLHRLLFFHKNCQQVVYARDQIGREIEWRIVRLFNEA